MRGRRLSLAAAVLTLTASLGWTARAQQPIRPAARPDAVASDPDPITIRVNAVVTDSRGRAVPGLGVSDFTLEDNGVAQALVSVEHREPPAASGAPAPIETDADEQRAAQEPGTRVFAIFLDEFHTSPGTATDSVRDAVLRFLDQDVRPADLVYVMKPLAAVHEIRFTRDRAAARALVSGFEGRKGDYEPRSDFERQFFGRSPAAVDFARSQIVTAALRELTLRIGELQPARAALILAAEGLSRSTGESRRLPGWLTLARAASHFNLPIYTLDPREPEPTGAVSSSSGPSISRSDPPAGATSGSAARPTTMETLAAETGGQSAAGAARLAPTLTGLSRDLDSFYVLTYRPSQPTDGRFHPIAVTPMRKGLQVRAPAGYWSPLASEWRTWLSRADAPPAPLPTRALHRSRFIDLWYGFEPRPDGSLRMLLTWSPSEGLPTGPRAPRPAAVALKASTAGGDALFDDGLPAVRVPAEVEGRATRAEFAVMPGRVQLDLAVQTPDGSQLDTGAQDVQVPVLRGTRPVVLQPQFIRARTRREVEQLGRRDDLSPAPGVTFRRTERLLLRVPVLAANGVTASVTATLVNVRGQRIRDLQALSSSPAGTAQFDMPLSYLPPGTYAIEIRVDSPGGAARQLVRFVLTG